MAIFNGFLYVYQRVADIINYYIPIYPHWKQDVINAVPIQIIQSLGLSEGPTQSQHHQQDPPSRPDSFTEVNYEPATLW